MPAICVNKSRHSLDLQFSFYDNSKEVSKLNDVFAFNAFRIKKRILMRKSIGAKGGLRASMLIWMAQVLHTRLQTSCSSLDLDLFHKNITKSLLRCGSVEDGQHFISLKHFSIQFVTT